MAEKKWVADPSHSDIQFKVKHLMITTVTGNFRKFHFTAQTNDNDFSTAKVYFEAETASIDTNDPNRDKHLRSGDFFESEKYPLMKFQSTSVEKTAENQFNLSGDLTIKDITKPVKLNVEFVGIMKDPYGNHKAGFSLNGKINRKDWGLNWNAVLESGGVLVSDEIRLFCEVQLVAE
jgi:polyisoprenoid-binding protein YceI